MIDPWDVFDIFALGLACFAAGFSTCNLMHTDRLYKKISQQCSQLNRQRLAHYSRKENSND